MSSQDEDEDDSSVASSSHDHSDDDWNGSDDNGAKKQMKKKSTAVAAGETSGRRQLPRRPSKPRSTIGFGSYKDSSSDSNSSSSSSGDDDDVVDVTTSNKNDDEKVADDNSSAASSDSPMAPQKQQPKKTKRKNNTTQSKQSATMNSKSNTSSSAKDKKKEVNSESVEEVEWDEDEKQSESSESPSDSDDSDFGAPPPSSSSKRRGSSSTKKGTKAKKSSPAAAKSNPTPRSRRTSTRKTYEESEQSSSSDDEEEIQYETTPSGTRRPRRSCSEQTKARMSKVVKQDMKSEREALGGVLEDDDKELLENSNDDDDGGTNTNDKEDDADDRRLKKRLEKNQVANGSATKRKRKLGAESTDEDYDENNNSESDQGDDSAVEEDVDDDDDDFEIGSDDMAVSRSTRKQNRGGKKKPNYTEINEEDIGTADEGTSDEEIGPSILTSPTTRKSPGSYGSPAVRKRARAGMGGRTPLDLREDDNSNEEDDDEGFEPSSKRKRKENPKTRKKRPYMDSSDSDDSDEHEAPTPHSGLRTTHIICSSLIDDITMMNLSKNKPHVCYVAPDGKSRHCFTLDTLYRIAISAKGGDDSTTSMMSAGLKFLQPPHFRSPMEDDLIDQIASRFGRSALVIENSTVYKKIKGGRLGSSNLDELDEFDEDGNFVGDGGEGNAVNFQDRFNRFITTLMGSSDVYCCPLCYIEADRRLGRQDDDEIIEDDESGDEQADDSQEDRFAFVDDPLTILGNPDSEAFEVASTFCFRLLSGLKKHLKVVHGVKLSDIEGNDLFKRFQVRAGDGLLQRWLQKNLRRNTVQGDMMRYWNSGENQSFLLLLSQIDRSQPEYSSDFSLSFPNRARKVWTQVSAPYMKHGQDLDDFLAGDDESEESVDGVPINPNFTPPSNLKSVSDLKSPEEEMIEHLQKKNRYKSALRSDSGGESSSSSDDDELEILDPKPTEESEEDDWTKSKSFKAKVKHKSQSSTNDSDDDNVFDSDVEIIEEKPNAKTPISARKRVMESSSDEESF